MKFHTSRTNLPNRHAHIRREVDYLEQEFVESGEELDSYLADEGEEDWDWHMDWLVDAERLDHSTLKRPIPFYASYYYDEGYYLTGLDFGDDFDGSPDDQPTAE